jgi:23S rRNA (cytidine2498-2'-O)-methyltransferase
MIETQIIFTTSKEYSNDGLREIKCLFKYSKFVEWLDTGIGRVQVCDTFQISAKKIREKSIFIRHIHPITFELNLKKKESDIKEFISLSPKIIILLNKNKSFSVQVRIIDSSTYLYSSFDILSNISNKIQELGYNLNVKNPDQVISIFVKNKVAFIGVSLTSNNLSKWSGGVCRLRWEDNQICRSEFKLLEVIQVLDLDIARYKKALDLGAAPGGWTRVLLSKGLHVVAVDPAELNPMIKANKNVIHFKCSAQNFLKRNRTKFDVIVDDMKIEAYKTVNLINLMQRYLNISGVVVVTIKLPKNNYNLVIKKSIELLEKHYCICFSKQLFHNRSEITMVLRHSNIKYGSNI